MKEMGIVQFAVIIVWQSEWWLPRLDTCKLVIKMHTPEVGRHPFAEFGIGRVNSLNLGMASIVVLGLASAVVIMAIPVEPISEPGTPDVVSARSTKPIVAFIIGLFIILLASLLNAGGLNLTKLDHVRTMAIPRASRRKDFTRPLWVLGMTLYILSQLIGSSLALEYMRAEYVAPLGSSSLIFNFLFASLLIGTPVTKTDIYGTAVVILGVIGIVAFGSINSGLKEDFSLEVLKHLWARGGWISYFILMTTLITVQYICNVQLDAVYAARSEISVLPTHRGPRPVAPVGYMGKAAAMWDSLMRKLRDILEAWTAPKDDKTIAWTLGIGWACGGGAMAGGSLVFAKATVKLISGSLNHKNTGNQFIHPAAFFTIFLLALSAVFQIICLNRGLKVYDSTLVVPMFYAIYTASGFLNSLIFMDEVDAYRGWTLFAIFVSIGVLIGGVVLLTSEKPEPKAPAQSTILRPVPRTERRGRRPKVPSSDPTDGSDPRLGDEGEGEDDALRLSDGEEDATMWQIGDDDEGAVDGQEDVEPARPSPPEYHSQGDDTHEEVHGLMAGDENEEREEVSHGLGSVAQARGSRTVPLQPLHVDQDVFGDWEDGAVPNHPP